MYRSGAVSVGLALVLRWCCPAVAFGDTPSFTGIGDLSGGGFNSGALAVSPDGSVVTGWGTADTQYRAIYWINGVMTDLGIAPGAQQSQATGVSQGGSVIVGFNHYASGQREAFRWTAGPGMVALGDLPGGQSYSHAYGVSADGSVVAGRGSVSTGDEAFRWTQQTGMVDLGNLPGAYGSGATAVSADGNVLVGYGASPAGREAVRWDNGVISSIGDLPGGPVWGFAEGVSADGRVVVGMGASGSDTTEAFRWKDGVMTNLGDLPGGIIESEARAASADGSVVVGYGTIGTVGSHKRQAFVWDQAHGMRNLTTVLAGYGINVSGWGYMEAWDVSDDGLTIVGIGSNPSGNAEGWVARIPEPTTGALMTIALLVLAGSRRFSRPT